MIKEKMRQAIDGVDAIVVIDPTDNLPNSWNPNGTDYWIWKIMTELAQKKGVPVYGNKCKGNIVYDSHYLAKKEVTNSWESIVEFDYDSIAEKIDANSKKSREELNIGFVGTHSRACVHDHLVSMCEDVQPESDRISFYSRKLENKFAKGKIIYELTEDKKRSFFRDKAILDYVLNKYLNK